jgi:hypothetical protein
VTLGENGLQILQRFVALPEDRCESEVGALSAQRVLCAEKGEKGAHKDVIVIAAARGGYSCAIFGEIDVLNLFESRNGGEVLGVTAAAAVAALLLLLPLFRTEGLNLIRGLLEIAVAGAKQILLKRECGSGIRHREKAADVGEELLNGGGHSGLTEG